MGSAAQIAAHNKQLTVMLQGDLSAKEVTLPASCRRTQCHMMLPPVTECPRGTKTDWF